MRVLVALAVVLVAVPIALAGLAAVVELPGEDTLKERLGFEVGVLRYGECEKVPGEGAAVVWRAEAPLPDFQDEARAVVVGDSVYIAGGIGSPTPQGTGTVVASFERYDIPSGTYERMPDLPIALDHLGITALGGAVYVTGGFGQGVDGTLATNRAFRFVIRERRWEELPPMAEARGAHGVVAVGHSIFVVGGRGDRAFERSRGNVALVEAFDTRTGTWSRVTTTPEPLDHLGVAAYDGRIYVFGGRTYDGAAVGRLDRYDPDANSWARLADGPVATSGIDLLAGDGFLYTAGGEVPREGQVHGGAWVYRVDSDRWEETARLPSPRHGYASVLHGGRVFLFGGSTCPGLEPTRAVASRPLQPS